MGLVLIVEDEDQVRVLAESYLRENGHRTLSASTAAEALALLGVSDGIEILFTDIVYYRAMFMVVLIWRSKRSNDAHNSRCCMRRAKPSPTV